MSVPNAGLAASAEYSQAEDPLKSNEAEVLPHTVRGQHATGQHDSSDGDEDEPPIAPDQYDPHYETTRKEIYSYYAYYVGNNGLTLFNFGPTLFQELLSLAVDPNTSTLRFLGAERDVGSIVLLANGISFAIQVVLFLVIGSYADYGSWRPNILIFWSIVAFALGFGWLGVRTPDKWPAATGLYMVGLIAYQMCLTFWTAAFPGLARNTPQMRRKAEEYERKQITRDEYDFEDMMQRNRISNVAFIVQSGGEIIILAILVGILFAMHVDDSVENNLRGLSVLIAYATGWWVVLGIPWFLIEKRRPGQELPAAMNIVSVGLWQLWRAMKQIYQLKMSLLYLIGYFLLGDSLNTTVTLVSILQNAVVEYSTLKLTYLLIVGIAAQFVGTWLFWIIQKRFKLSTKTMFNAVMISIILLDGWGMIGIWTDKFGFHNVWEFWVYQTFYGFFVCPWYSYSQTMISEVTPRGHEFLFFSLFSIMGKTSAFIGPIVSSRLVDASRNHNNNSVPFYFLFGLSVFAFLILFFGVDLKKSRREQALFLETERKVKEVRRNSLIVIESAAVSNSEVNGAEDTKHVKL